ncbi:MAG TPA: DUF4231 domain-containing protein [Acetobacteraceae bacterium]|jgi:hypothetical protein|nr:DUF4231 domain-containing protein [Acetobacteraceae bacterium]
MADDARPITASYAERERRCAFYFDRTLAGQRQWYGRKASAYKRRAEALALLVIAAGALVAFIPAFGADPWVRITTGALGALVAVMEGWQRTARYAESWTAYRVASEKMKREQRLYLTGAGPYRGATDEDAAFLRFVEAIEAVIAEEQQIYWRDRGTETRPATDRE